VGAVSRRRAVLLGAVLGLTFAALPPVASAAGARQPTLKERGAITGALPARLRSYPIVWLNIVVSRNGRFAKVVADVFDATRPPCLKYAANGFYILRKSASWRIIFSGSVSPPCALGVPPEILGRLGCKR